MICLDKISSLSTYSTQKCCHTVLIYVILLNNSHKVFLVMAVLPLTLQVHLQQFFTHLCMCACACVCKRETACVCVEHSETQKKFANLAKTGDLGRVACGDFSCYCVLDACCPLTLLTATRPFLMLITCVCVCGCPYVSACLWLLLILVSTATGAVLCGCRCVCLVRRGSHESSCEKEREREHERETE